MPIPPNLTPEEKRNFYAKLTPEEYHATLSRRCVGVGVILKNAQDQLLIVKPNYKEGWLVPGGTIDDEETPAQTAIRETLEEIGITLSEVKFLSVGHTSRPGAPEFIEFMFSGGVLDDAQSALITLQTAELDEYKFVDVATAMTMLRAGPARRVATALRALATGVPVYEEWKG